MNRNLNNNLTPQTAVKTTAIIHLGLTAGQILFAIVAYTTTPQKGFAFDGVKDPFIYVAIILALNGFIVGNLMFKKQVGKVVPEDTLSKKISVYQTAFIIRAALLEGASLFSIAVYLIGWNLFFLALSGLIILYFLTLRPTKEKIANDMNLDYNEKAELDGQPVN